MPPVDTAIITTFRMFDTNVEKDQRSFRPKSQGDEVEKSIQNRFLDSAFGSARNDGEAMLRMTEQDLKSEKQKGRRFSRQQYDMLKRCSDKKDMTEWNQWRMNHPSAL